MGGWVGGWGWAASTCGVRVHVRGFSAVQWLKEEARRSRGVFARSAVGAPVGQAGQVDQANPRKGVSRCAGHLLGGLGGGSGASGWQPGGAGSWHVLMTLAGRRTKGPRSGVEGGGQAGGRAGQGRDRRPGGAQAEHPCTRRSSMWAPSRPAALGSCSVGGPRCWCGLGGEVQPARSAGSPQAAARLKVLACGLAGGARRMPAAAAAAACQACGVAAGSAATWPACMHVHRPTRQPPPAPAPYLPLPVLYCCVPQLIAKSLPLDEISGMREIFLDIDKDKSGTIRWVDPPSTPGWAEAPWYTPNKTCRNFGYGARPPCYTFGLQRPCPTLCHPTRRTHPGPGLQRVRVQRGAQAQGRAGPERGRGAEDDLGEQRSKEQKGRAAAVAVAVGSARTLILQGQRLGGCSITSEDAPLDRSNMEGAGVLPVAGGGRGWEWWRSRVPMCLQACCLCPRPTPSPRPLAAGPPCAEGASQPSA